MGIGRAHKCYRFCRAAIPWVGSPMRNEAKAMSNSKATIIAAVLGAIAVILGAIVAGLFGLVAAFMNNRQQHSISLPPNTTSSILPPSQTRKPSAPSSSPRATSQTQRTSPGIQWQGPITIGSAGVNLDALPQSTSSGATFQMEQDFNGGGMSLMGGGPDGSWAVWSGSSAPTHQQCQHLLFTDDPAPVTPGLKICAITADGHWAYVGFTTVQSDSAKANIIVWTH